MKPINLYELIDAALEQDDTGLNASDKKILNKRPNSVLDFIQKALNEEIERRTEKELETRAKLPALSIPDGPHRSEVFLPEKNLALAEEMFDQCGSVRIVIDRTHGLNQVTVSKRAQDIQIATPEDEAKAPGVSLSNVVANLPVLQEGEEIVLPDPPQARNLPGQKPHLREIEDSQPKQETNPIVELVQKEIDKTLKPPGLPVFIGLPTQGEFHWAVNYSILGQYKKCLGKVKITSRIDIRRARNIIVQSFLASDAEWLYMQDDDILAPFGSAGLFRELAGERALSFSPDFMGLVAAETLIQSGKTMVGGVYATRSAKREIVCNLGMKPRDDADKEQITEIRKAGPKSGLVKVAWMGFGCVAIHRTVFTDISDKMPEIVKLTGPEPTDFFDFTGGGEDVTFCQRAAKAGHFPYLNTAVWCAHMGQYPYLP